MIPLFVAVGSGITLLISVRPPPVPISFVMGIAPEISRRWLPFWASVTIALFSQASRRRKVGFSCRVEGFSDRVKGFTNGEKRLSSRKGFSSRRKMKRLSNRKKGFTRRAEGFSSRRVEGLSYREGFSSRRVERLSSGLSYGEGFSSRVEGLS